MPNLRTLWDLTRGQRLRYVLAIVALAVATLLMFVPPLVIAAVIDGALTSPPVAAGPARQVLDLLGGPAELRSNLWLAGVLLVGVVAVGGVFSYARGHLSAIACESLIRGLRDRLYAHFQHLPIGWFDKHATGDLVQRCTSDVETTRNFYQSQIVEIADALVRLAVVLPILIALDWRMAIAATVVLPVIVTFAVVFFSRVQGTFKAMDEAEGAMSATMQENLTGIRVVRAFARQDFEQQKFAVKNQTHRDLNFRFFQVMATYWASSDFLCFLQLSAVTITGGFLAASGTLPLGTYVSFMLFTGMYLWPVRHMGRILTELGKTLVALGRINEVLSAPLETDPARPVRLPTPVRGRVEFRGVSFSHGEKRVLHDVSFTAEPGQTIALLGPSGAGKSTIMSLLLRFYDPERGVITIDGVDLARVPRKEVRSHFGVVMQEPFLFSKTIAENIKLGRFDAAQDDVITSAADASIHQSIVGFEKQYDTVVGERGVTLSGGQRQRVAIARALLKDAPLLILDDALSAVDTHTEADILAALRRRRGVATTLLIAHRLSTLMHADLVLVIERGRIVQRGSHDQLVRQNGLYKSLWHIQSELEDDLAAELGGEVSTAARPSVTLERGEVP